MTKKIHKTSIHHVLTKYAWWTNNDINKQVMREVQHRAHHTLFWPANPPEQIEIILHRNIQILREEFVERILNSIEGDPQYIYKNWVYIPNKYKKDTSK